MKVLEFIGWIAVAIVIFFVNIYLKLKIYALILIPLGAPQLDMWQMWGLMLFISTFFHIKRDKDADKYSALSDAITHTVGTAIAWGLAYLVFG